MSMKRNETTIPATPTADEIPTTPARALRPDPSPALRGLARDLMRAAACAEDARAGLDVLSGDHTNARAALRRLDACISGALAMCDPARSRLSRDLHTGTLSLLAAAIGGAAAECMTAAALARDLDGRADVSILHAAVQGLAALAPGAMRRVVAAADLDAAAWAAPGPSRATPSAPGPAPTSGWP